MYFSKRSPYIYALSLTRLCRELPPGGSLAECQLLDLTKYYGTLKIVHFTHQISFAMTVWTGRRGRRPLPRLCICSSEFAVRWHVVSLLQRV